MASQVFTHLCTFFALVAGASAWRCAKYQHYFSQQPDYIDCFWDCCGNSFNRHCCAPIGIIVGCSIVGAVIVAALTVLFVCWWQRRRARRTKGPKLFHNRRHSHYPVAPTSVTRPAPQTSSYGAPPHAQRAGYPPYPGEHPPPQRGYAPGPGARPHPNQGYQGYRAPPQQQNYDSDRERSLRSEKPPIDFYDSDRERQGPQVYRDNFSDYDSDRGRMPPRPRAVPMEEKPPKGDDVFI